MEKIKYAQRNHHNVLEGNNLCIPCGDFSRHWISITRNDQFISCDNLGERITLCDGFGKTRAIGVIAYYSNNSRTLIIKILETFS